MKRIIIILFLASICYGRPFVLLAEGDVYTSHQLPNTDSTLDIGSAAYLWRYVYGDAFTDGTALWSDNNLSGFTSISGLTFTDTVLSINAGSITSAVDGTFSGTLTGNTLTDGTFIVTGGIVTAGTWQGDTITVPYGGTGATTLTDGGILLGSGVGAITALGVAANGQIPIGDGTTDPVLATITGGTNLTSVPGAGSITLNVDDAFLVNDGDDTTTGTVTAAGFTTTGTVDTGILIVDTDTLVANVTGHANEVGVGTATPDRRFEVLDAGGTPFRLTKVDSTNYHDFSTDGTGLSIQGSNAASNSLRIGTDDTVRGIINLWGHATGTDFGGMVHCYTSDDHDALINSYGIIVYEDDLWIGPITDQDSLKYDGGTGDWTFTGTGETITDVFVVGSNAPATSTSAGTAGTITYDANYIYVAVANNSWKRAALSAWALDMLLLDDGVSKLLLDDGASFLLIR